MSWWDDIEDIAGGIATSLFNGGSDSDNQKDLINQQIKAYQEQTALTRKQLQDAQNSADVEKRRVNEKQIRALRSNYRGASGGMLGVGAPASPDTSNTLGS